MAQDNRLLKAFSNVKDMVFPRQNGWNAWSLPRANYDHAKAVGDGTNSSTIMAPIEYIKRTFPDAPVTIAKLLDDGQEEYVAKHDMITLLHRPNKFYSGRTLWEATIADYYLSGNAYWLKLHNKAGGVGELWWIPSSLIEPRKPDNGDTTTFIDYYDYRPNGEELRLDPADVVHFRYGIDPDNQMEGRSPLSSVLREVFTDDEAANYTASLLKNMGVPGLIVSPKEGNVNTQDPDALKKFLSTAFTGDKRGEPLVFGAPTELETFGFSPQDMNLKDLRRIPEERVSAVLGIPAIVAGLGAGLDRSTFSNYEEARRAAYESNIIPAQKTMAEEIKFQLLVDFEDDPMAWCVEFDTSDIQILQEDLNKKAERLTGLVSGGVIKRAEARRELDFDAEDYDEVYLISASLEEVVPGEEKEEPEPVVMPVPFPPVPPTEEAEENEEPADAPKPVEEDPKPEEE